MSDRMDLPLNELPSRRVQSSAAAGQIKSMVGSLPLPSVVMKSTLKKYRGPYEGDTSRGSPGVHEVECVKSYAYIFGVVSRAQDGGGISPEEQSVMLDFIFAQASHGPIESLIQGDDNAPVYETLTKLIDLFPVTRDPVMASASHHRHSQTMG